MSFIHTNRKRIESIVGRTWNLNSMGCPRMYNHKERVYSNKFLASYPLSHSNGRLRTFRLATLPKSGILSVLDPTAKDKVIPHFNGGSDRKTYSSSEVEKMAHRHSSILFAGTPLYAHAHMGGIEGENEKGVY
jgi:hypothetical protein